MAERYAFVGDRVFTEETVAGGLNERRVVDKLSSIFKEYVDWISYVDTPVDTWFEEKCLVHASGSSYDCRALPYTTEVRAVGKPVLAQVVNGKPVVKGLDSPSIVFLKFPEEVDLVKFLVLDLSTLENVEAIVLYDEKPGVFRRVVVNWSPFYSFNTGCPNPVPVVSMKREDCREILREAGRVELEVKAGLKRGVIGRTVLMGLNGRGEGEIHVTAHHDHWFSGVSDNLVGLETLLKVAKELRRGWSGLNVVLVSYTAEEFGALGYVSWYWAWGSRFYLSVLDKKGVVDSIRADINVDALLEEPIEVYYNPLLKKCIERLGDGVLAKPFEHMDFDSFSYSLMGVPSVNLTTISSLKPIYHSNLDDGSRLNYGVVESTFRKVLNLTSCLSEVNHRFGDLVNHLYVVFGENVPLEVKNLVHKIATLDADLGDWEKVRLVGKLLVKATYTLGLDHVHFSGLLSDLILLKNIYENVENYVDKRLVVMNFDENVLSLSIKRRNLDSVREVLRETMVNRALNYINLLEKEYLVYRALGKASSPG